MRSPKIGLDISKCPFSYNNHQQSITRNELVFTHQKCPQTARTPAHLENSFTELFFRHLQLVAQASPCSNKSFWQQNNICRVYKSESSCRKQTRIYHFDNCSSFLETSNFHTKIQFPLKKTQDWKLITAGFLTQLLHFLETHQVTKERSRNHRSGWRYRASFARSAVVGKLGICFGRKKNKTWENTMANAGVSWKTT